MAPIQKQYTVKMTGQTPLLLHADNVSWSERVKKWQKAPANKSKSVAGDDRSPSWLWLGYAYVDRGVFVIDVDNIMAMCRDAGKKCPAATGRGSLKAATQSGIQVNEMGWPIEVGNGPIQWKPFRDLADELDFEKHEALAEKNGFELFMKRARIGQNKHIRIRPMFREWSASGTITVLDDTLTLPVLQTLFDVAGSLVGVGDWRPSSPASGRYGIFTAEVKEL